MNRLLAATIATALSAAPAFGQTPVAPRDLWQLANDCAARLPQPFAEPSVDTLTMGEVSRRIIALAVGLDRENPYAGLTLDRVCGALRLPLRDNPAALRLSSLPHGPPPGPDEHRYDVILLRPAYAIHASYYSGPNARSVDYSISSDADPPAFGGRGLFADMGDRCELRAEAAAGLLQAGDYAMLRVAYETPDAARVGVTDTGPRLVFERGGARVVLFLQGEPAAQRARGLEACVGRVEVFMRNPST